MAPLPIPAPNSQAVNTGGGVPSFIAVWWNFFNSLLAYVTTGPIGPTPLAGFTDGSSAASGIVGEYISSVLQTGSATSLVNNTAKDVLSLSVPAGDWNVWGDIFYNAAATTVVTNAQGWIGTATVTIPTTLPAAIADIQTGGKLNAGFTVAFSLNGLQMRVSSAGTTTLFLSTRTNFATSTLAAYGQLQARRIR
jgi:hypothetical protein